MSRSISRGCAILHFYHKILSKHRVCARLHLSVSREWLTLSHRLVISFLKSGVKIECSRQHNAKSARCSNACDYLSIEISISRRGFKTPRALRSRLRQLVAKETSSRRWNRLRRCRYTLTRNSRRERGRERWGREREKHDYSDLSINHSAAVAFKSNSWLTLA